MAQIMTTCPITGAAVATSRHATDAEWAQGGAASLEEGGLFRCTECSQTHQWARASAWLRAPSYEGSAFPG